MLGVTMRRLTFQHALAFNGPRGLLEFMRRDVVISMRLVEMR